MRQVLQTANRVITIVIIFVVGLAMIGVGILTARSSKGVYAETTGKITDIQIVEDPNPADDVDETEYHVFVEYTVEDETYEQEYDSYNFKMKVGNEVTVLYNVDDPSQIKSPGADFLPYILMAVGVVCLIIGVIIVIRSCAGRM